VNSFKEEMTKLKTKIMQMQQEISKRDKDIEMLTIALQSKSSIAPPSQGGKDSNIYESFLVTQLKK
jgi:hypothetical protein